VSRRMRHPRPFLFVVAFGLGAGALAGCASDPSKGYSFAPVTATQARSVGVPIFENGTFTKGVEADLTEAIIKELQRTTQIDVTRSANAETVLTGVVTDSELKRIAVDSQTGYVDQLAVRITVDFDWKDNRTGKVLLSRRSFSAVDSFSTARRAGELVEQGQHSAVQRLARAIVEEMRSSW